MNTWIRKLLIPSAREFDGSSADSTRWSWERFSHLRRSAPLAWLGVTVRQLDRPRRSRYFAPEDEQAFQRAYAANSYAQARFGLSLGFLAWCSLAIWDALGWSAACSAQLIAIRLLLVAPFIGFVWWVIVRRPDLFKAHMQFYLFLGPAAASFGLLLMMATAFGDDPREAFQIFWPSFAAVYFFQYAFLGLQFTPAACLGNLTLALVWSFGLRSGAELHVLGAALLQLAILNFLGMIICGRNEIHQRTLFRLREHYRHQLHTAQAERINAQQARDEAMLQSFRAEGAIALADAERGRLAVAVEAKERFFSAAYHDLQQPLSVIGLYVKLAKGKLADAPEHGVNSDLSIIEGASQDIALMFKGVRDTWEIGNAMPTVESVELGAVLGEIARELAERANQKGLDFRVRNRMLPLYVRSDRTLLKRALSNLVSNAIKYTERGGVLVGAVDSGSQVRIDVWDTGVGIPAEFQMRIFDEYFQVRNGDRDRRRGLGLGLAIVRRIEETLPGHRLSFFSKPGHGSRFSLAVPLADEPVAERIPAPAPLVPVAVQDGLAGKYVVIVEDEPLILEALVASLRRADSIVEGVASAAAARVLFAERDRCPDILITDFRLRCGETGLDAVAAMRERFEWATGTPVLFVTGELMATATLSDFPGLCEVFCKPIDPDRLLLRLHALINRRSAHHAPPGSVAQASRDGVLRSSGFAHRRRSRSTAG